MASYSGNSCNNMLLGRKGETRSVAVVLDKQIWDEPTTTDNV